MSHRSFLREVIERIPLRDQNYSKGVIHIGAHHGDEAWVYDSGKMNVLWVEANPCNWEGLTSHIERYKPKQTCVLQLIADTDGTPVTFYKMSNGVSSSMLELGEHLTVHPDITCVEQITLTTCTLSTLVKRNNIDLSLYDMISMDVQGAELLVLKGAKDILPHFKYVITEASDFEVYKGCGRIEEIEAFMTENGFRREQICNFGNVCGNVFIIGYVNEAKS